MKRWSRALLTLSFTVPAVRAQEPHPFSIHDMLAMDRISDPVVSPDGKTIAFVVRVTDVSANKGRTDLWSCAVDGSNLVQLTKHEAADSAPQWMPDGSIAFLSTRSGSSQVWQLEKGAAEPKQLTKLALDVDNFLVFPDGKRLLLTMEVYPDLDPKGALEKTAARDKERDEKKVKARVYDSLLFRHWDNWEDGKRSHVFAFEIGSEAPIDLIPGFDGDAPTKPFGGADEIAIAPNGQDVAFTAQQMSRDAAWSTDANIWLVPARGGVQPRCISCDNKGLDTGPAFSPDGVYLAYRAMERAGYESDRQQIVVYQAREVRRLVAKDWDRSASEIVWAPDSKTIYTSADNLGQHSLYAVDVPSGKVRTLVETGTNNSPRVAGDRVVFAKDTLTSPVELYSVALDGSGEKPITKINAAKVAAAKMGTFEQYTFTGAKNEKVYGFVMKPAGFVEGKKYPVAMLIHGGPQGSFGNHFHYRWNPQAYAGAGYAVVFIDFHGSTGYGQAFCDSIRGDWGGAPYEDLMKGLDAAIAKYPFLDGDRVAALGASYGGYMINWIAGQTDRFKCLVSHDGNLDERMAYFDTEELWFPEWDHGGTPWTNPEGYAKHNPIDFVKNWKTPILVIHGGQDFRVVETQGMSTFTAAQRMGIPSKFLHFPDENHWVLKPQNSILWHETVMGWLDQWTGKSGMEGEGKGSAHGSGGNR